VKTARGVKCEDIVEGCSMKLMCIILSFAILFTGCYTNTTVTKDDILDSSSGLTFVLKDGSSIEANSWCYFRLENGYQIASSDGTPGIIALDEQIETIMSKETDTGATVGVGILLIGVIAGIVWLVAASQALGGGLDLANEWKL
jgi:hypothetical protein